MARNHRDLESTSLQTGTEGEERELVYRDALEPKKRTRRKEKTELGV